MDQPKYWNEVLHHERYGCSVCGLTLWRCLKNGTALTHCYIEEEYAKTLPDYCERSEEA